MGLYLEILKIAPNYFNPIYVLPNMERKNLNHINPESLKEKHGIQTLLFDIDDTIDVFPAESVNPEIKEGFDNLIKYFGESNVRGLSSGIGNGYYDGALKKKFEENTGLILVSPSVVKPNPNAVTELLEDLGWDKESTAFIGNSPLDVICANLAGVFSVLVEPLPNENQPIHSKIIRNIGKIGPTFYKKLGYA